MDFMKLIDLRHAAVPFSFILVDCSLVGFEIVNPLTPDSFYFGILVDSEEIYDMFLKLFTDLKEMSEALEMEPSKATPL